MFLGKSIAATGLAALLLVSSEGIHAESKPSSQYEACMDNVDFGASKNSQWASCAAEEIGRQDVTLNVEYNRMRKSLARDQRELLTKAQKTWLKFREDWCRFEEIAPTAPGGDVNYLFCIMTLTNKQIDVIRSLAL